MSIESIQQRIQIIKDISDELKKLKSLYDESLENDVQYTDLQEDVSKFREEMKIKKAKITLKPEFADFEEQLKDLKEDLKENREILSQELAEYYKESGKQEIVGPDGNKKRMKFSVTLINTSE